MEASVLDYSNLMAYLMIWKRKNMFTAAGKHKYVRKQIVRSYDRLLSILSGKPTV